VGRMVTLTVQVVAALTVLAVSAAVAFGAWPLGLWLGWRVASGGWVLPELSGEPVAVWRIVAGVMVGSMLVRFGLLLRRQFVLAWQAERDAAG
jgi:hypothetical protein